MAANWYALHTRSQFEPIVSEQLTRIELPVFYPTYTQESKWHDRIKTIVRPLFPGYLFSQFELGDAGRVQALRGVAHILGDGVNPLAIPDSEIEVVRQLLSCGYPVSPVAHIQVGMRVVVEHGPLQGIEGTVLKLKKRCQVVVSIDLLRQGVGVEMNAEWLRVI